MKRTAMAFGLALVAMAIAPLKAQAPKKAVIIHNGNQISVSCKALDGHRQHADRAEALSIRRAEVRCRVR